MIKTVQKTYIGLLLWKPLTIGYPLSIIVIWKKIHPTNKCLKKFPVFKNLLPIIEVLQLIICDQFIEFLFVCIYLSKKLNNKVYLCKIIILYCKIYTFGSGNNQPPNNYFSSLGFYIKFNRTILIYRVAEK